MPLRTYYFRSEQLSLFYSHYNHKAQGATTMGRGNDAIPSWSGFNYQGKITILCALQEINKNWSVEEYSIELEKHEDFTILRKNKTLALYQVKAIFSQKNIIITRALHPETVLPQSLLSIKMDVETT